MCGGTVNTDVDKDLAACAADRPSPASSAGTDTGPRIGGRPA